MDSDDTWSLVDSDDSEGNAQARNNEIGKSKIEEKKYPKCLSKEVPKHKWSVTKAILNRFVVFFLLFFLIPFSFLSLHLVFVLVVYVVN